jgi:phospholipase C
LSFEDGFKECVGNLTEGRYLVFEASGFALMNPSSDPLQQGSMTLGSASEDHSSKNQRWVVHYSQGEESGIFKISSALDGRWMDIQGRLLRADNGTNAADVRVTFLGNGKGYKLEYVESSSTVMETSFLEALNNTGQTKDSPLSFNTWSVSYHD